jgi:hypothetical protein
VIEMVNGGIQREGVLRAARRQGRLLSRLSGAGEVDAWVQTESLGALLLNVSGGGARSRRRWENDTPVAARIIAAAAAIGPEVPARTGLEERLRELAPGVFAYIQAGGPGLIAWVSRTPPSSATTTQWSSTPPAPMHAKSSSLPQRQSAASRSGD